MTTSNNISEAANSSSTDIAQYHIDSSEFIKNCQEFYSGRKLELIKLIEQYQPCSIPALINHLAANYPEIERPDFYNKHTKALKDDGILVITDEACRFTSVKSKKKPEVIKLAKVFPDLINRKRTLMNKKNIASVPTKHTNCFAFDDQGKHLNDDETQALLKSQSLTGSVQLLNDKNLTIEDLQTKNLQTLILQIIKDKSSALIEQQLNILDSSINDNEIDFAEKINALEAQIKTKDKEARKTLIQEDKLQLQQERENLIKERDQLRLNLYNLQGQINQQKGELLNKMTGFPKSKKIRYKGVLLLEWEIEEDSNRHD